jgi:hypothetical protein
MPTKIAHILLPADVVRGDDHAPVDWLGRFSGKLVRTGPYQWRDLPPVARAFEALDIYAGEVANGGHFQWLQNRRYEEDEVAACKAGMAMLPTNPFQPIFARAVHLIEDDPGRRDRFRARDINGWSEAEFKLVDDGFKALDHKFYREAGGSDALIKLLRAALLARPEVQLVDDWQARVDALIRAAGGRPFDRDSYVRASHHWRMINGVLVELCRHAGRSKTGPFSFLEEPRLRPGLTSLRFETDRGPAKAVLMSDKAALFELDSYEPIVSVRLPDEFRIDVQNLRDNEDHIRKSVLG